MTTPTVPEFDCTPKHRQTHTPGGREGGRAGEASVVVTDSGLMLIATYRRDQLDDLRMNVKTQNTPSALDTNEQDFCSRFRAEEKDA